MEKSKEIDVTQNKTAHQIFTQGDETNFSAVQEITDDNSNELSKNQINILKDMLTHNPKQSMRVPSSQLQSNQLYPPQ